MTWRRDLPPEAPPAEGSAPGEPDALAAGRVVDGERDLAVAGSYRKSFPSHWNDGGGFRSVTTTSLLGGYFPCCPK